MKAFLKGSVTDAQGRPEPKMVAGLGFLFLAFLYALAAILTKWTEIVWNQSIFTALAAVGIGLVGGTAVADAINDFKMK